MLKTLAKQRWRGRPDLGETRGPAGEDLGPPRKEMILPLPETETDRNNHPQVIIVIFALLMAALWTGYSYYFPYKMGHDQTLVGTMVA